MSGPEDARGPKAVARFLRPRSVAIVGISSRAGSAGQVILQSLKLNKFKGDIHLVGRSNEPIDGRPVLKSADELPEGVDLAVFTLPAAGVREAIEACARRKVGSAMIFAAGFAEVGDQATQDAVTNTARAAGLAVVGPNCLGVTNNVDGMMLHMLYAREAQRGVEGRHRLRRPERRLARPLPARRRRARPAAHLRDLDRQRGRPRKHRFPRIPGRRPRHPRDRDLLRANPPAAGIPRRLPPRARGRQADRADAGGPRRQGAQGRAVAHRRADRRFRHDADPGRGRRRHRRLHHGRDDGSRRNPGALSGPAHQGARHSHRVGRLCGADQRFRRGGRPRASRARAGHAEDGQRGAAGLRQLRQSARRHRRLLAGFAAHRGQGADRRSQCRDAVHLVSDQLRRGRSRPSTRAWRTRPSPRSWWRSATPGSSLPTSCRPSTKARRCSRARRTACCARSRSIPATDARSPAPACAANPAPFPGMPKLGKGAQPEWLGKKVLSAAGIRVPDGELARTAGRRRRGRQARRLSGGPEGAGRGAVAQDRSRRRHAQPRRRGGAARGLGRRCSRTSSARRPA